MVTPLYFGFLGLLGLERVFELALARRNARKAFARGAAEVGQGHYRVMVIFHTAFLACCALEPWLLRRSFPQAVGIAALCGALLAQGLRYWAIATLGDRWNSRIIVVPGEKPVVGGPYRWVRHPNYVAVCLEMPCVPLVHGAWLTALVFSLGNALLLTVRIRMEETVLGAQYTAQFGATPRFVPFPRGAPRG
jgi:methyltransferase